MELEQWTIENPQFKVNIIHLEKDEERKLNLTAKNVLSSIDQYVDDRPAIEGDEWTNPETGESWIYQNSNWEKKTYAQTHTVRIPEYNWRIYRQFLGGVAGIRYST